VFNNSLSAASLVGALIEELDAEPDIDPARYSEWLNETEQTLYSEIIKELARVDVPDAVSPVEISALVPTTGADAVRFEDIYTVYAGKVQLMKGSLLDEFPDTYWKTAEKLGFFSGSTKTNLKIYCYVRPRPKELNSTAPVMLPVEWLPLIRAKLRGEAYKLVNEDSMSAKWLNDYNALLEGFKEWCDLRRPQFGV
jgi:hypothetical protein